MKNIFAVILFMAIMPSITANSATAESIITFADETVKALCVQNWDTNNDGELSMEEAANVTSIGSVFKSNSSINSFDEFQYFTGLASTGYQAFSGCSSLAHIKLPSSINLIGSYAFFNCSALTSFTIPNTVTQINYEAFGNCTGLISINIPNSVDTIGNRVFRGCSGLTSITVDSNNTTYDSRNDCNAIIETASNTLVTGCQNTMIPYNVTAISGYAFYGCSGLTSITIPHSVISIGDLAFHGCTGLTAVTCFATVPPAISNSNSIPSAVTNQATLYVPIGTKNAYQAAEHWRAFSSIQESVVLATSIELNMTTAQLTQGEVLQLSASVLPEETTDKTVTWASNNTNVASVDASGLVTAFAAGTATITATTTDGSNLSASCEVTVIHNESDADNYFSMNDITAFAGDTIIIPISLINKDDITAFQTDIYLPDGFEIIQEDGEYAVELSSRKTKNHFIVANETIEGYVRVLCYTPDGKPFAGNNGELFYITVKTPENADGAYILWLRNSFLTKTDGEEISIDDAACNISVYSIIPGDANNSGTVTVTDIVVTAEYILNYNPQPFVFEAADVNSDGKISVTDVVKIARLVLNSNQPRLMTAFVNALDDYMSGDDITLSASAEANMANIKLDNAVEYTAFQFDMILPEGLTANNFQLTNRASSHAIGVSTLDNGDLRILCYSPIIQSIIENDGAVLTFDVRATSNVYDNIIVKDIEMITSNGQTVTLNDFAIKVNDNRDYTSVSDINTDTKVYAKDKCIIIDSPKEQTAYVCDMMGHQDQVKLNTGHNIIAINKAGIYVVNGETMNVKLILK